MNISNFGVKSVAALLAGFLACSCGLAVADSNNATLRGDNESPAVDTAASGYASITVGPDKSVTGNIKTSGIVGTVAHIHEGAAEKSGAVVATLVKTADDTWSLPAGVVLSDAQFESYKAGELYVDVHSAAHHEGEIRGQLKP